MVDVANATDPMRECVEQFAMAAAEYESDSMKQRVERIRMAAAETNNAETINFRENIPPPPSQCDVIIVNVRKGWDAKYIPGISSVYQIFGSKFMQKDDETFDLYVRKQPCFCEKCRVGHFERCLKKAIVGDLQPRTSKKLPLVPALPGAPIDMLQVFEFFDGPLECTADNSNVVLVALERSDLVGERQISVALMTKPPKLLTKALNVKYNIRGSECHVYINKNEYCIGITLLDDIQFEGEIAHIKPPKAREMKINLRSVIFIPSMAESKNRFDYIRFSQKRETVSLNARSSQRIIYKVNGEDLEKLSEFALNRLVQPETCENLLCEREIPGESESDMD